MKLKKILAAVAAAAVAVSTMAVNAFAIDKGTYMVDDGGNTFLYLVADDGKPQYAVDNYIDVTSIYGVTWHATFAEAEVADDAAWIGGGIGANSNSTGWKQLEWGRSGKDYIADLENGTITWKSADPIFKADDAYVQLWITTWGGTVTFDSVDILDKDGNVIQPGEAPAETEAPAEDDAAADEAEAPEADEADEDVDEPDEVEDEAEEPAEEPAPAETEAPAAEVAPAAVETPAPATGNTAVASVVAVMAVAGAAAIAAKKRK